MLVICNTSAIAFSFCFVACDKLWFLAGAQNIHQDKKQSKFGSVIP